MFVSPTLLGLNEQYPSTCSIESIIKDSLEGNEADHI